MGRYQLHGVAPDIATFAKGMANGMSLGAVMGRREVMKVAEQCIISVTFGGKALSLAAGIATLQVCREQRAHEHLNRVGRHLMEGINAAAQNAGLAMEAYGPPTLFSTRFLDAQDRREAGLMLGFILAGLAQRGILLRPTWNNVTFSHSDADIQETIAAVEETLVDLRHARELGRLAEELAAVTVPLGRAQ